MQRIESLPPTSIGNPEIDWGFMEPNQSMGASFQVQDGEIIPDDAEKDSVPEELREVVGVMDGDYRSLNGLDASLPVNHGLRVRSGFENNASLWTSAVAKGLLFRPPKHQLHGFFHLDSASRGEQNPLIYTLSSRVATEFMLGDFHIVNNKPNGPMNAFGSIIANSMLLKFQEGLIMQPEPGELVRFDTLSSVHRSPYRRHDGSGTDHMFFRNVVYLDPVSEDQ